jgi:hypothetical protein
MNMLNHAWFVQVLKLYAWEESFKANILGIREKELHVLKVSQYLSAASAVSWFMAPYLVRFHCLPV